MSELPTIPVARPLIGTEEAEEVARVLASGWITQGPEVARFEQEFAAAVGAPHAVALSNCTTALHLALVAAGAAPGTEVITASHSYIATANAVVYTGAQPVFADVDPVSFNLSPESVEAAISPRTVAILAVHQVGMPCDLESLLRITRKHNIPLIEDAACAIGSEIHINGQWERIGKPHGDAACFSFHPRKLLSTGDGGMITTRREDWLAFFRRARQHSMSVPDTQRHSARQVIFEAYEEIGWNYRMTDIQAAVGRVQLRRLDDIVSRRKALALLYQKYLADLAPIVQLPIEPTYARTNWQSYTVRLASSDQQVAVMQHMLDAGISTRRAVMNSHREPAYSAPSSTAPGWCHAKPACGCPSGSCKRLATSEAIQDSGIILPLYHQMTEDDVQRVASALRAAVGAR